MTLQVQVVLTAILTALIAGGLSWLASWGLLPGLDIDTVSSGLASAIATFIVGLVAAWVQAFMVKQQAIINAAAKMPAVEKIVVNDPKVWDASPDNVVRE
jgi:hypothetical protein